MEIDAQVRQFPLRLKGGLQATPIASMLAQLSLIHLDVYLTNGRIDVDHPLGRCLADDLLVGATLFRHEDEDVSLNKGCTG